MTVRIGVVGVGSMGALHARVVAGHPGAELGWVSDPNSDAGQRVAERFGTKWIPEPDLGSVDAVIVAAPTQYHFDLANAVIDNGTPLLLEKPLADVFSHTSAIVESASRRGVPLMCGLLERFNPAVRTAAEIADEPLRIATMRHSPYSGRIATGVGSDLLIHDLDLVLRLTGDYPSSAHGHFGYFAPTSEIGAEDVAEASLKFTSGRIAVLSASRTSQHKVRSLSIAERNRLIDVDLLRQSITIYRHVDGAAFDESAGYSQQTIIEIPVIRYTGEPLQLQLDHFLRLLNGDVDQEMELRSVLPPHRLLDEIASSATDS
ncbi:MAG: Gfo/Idh/MocA family oxidoreductase [Ilumatobacteraceae bacterium]